MGKEWLYWGGGGGGGASNSAKKRRSRECREMEEAAAAPGCMCAVFNFWDLHHLPFTLPHQARPSLSPDTGDDTLLQDEPSARKGLEAPRNSLELNEKILEASSSSSTMKYDENLNIPVGIRIRTSCRGTKTEDNSSSECSSSPGIKPPNLVARLMGLDLLPESGSPSSFSRQSTSPSLTNRTMHSRQYLYSHSSHDVSGTVSLPETPRISLARKSDVEHHRLSLQSLKENIEERLDVSILGGRKIRGRNSEEEINTSPAHYARRIVKQVKDRVSRKVGVDITNTISTNRDDHLLVLNPKKKPALLRKVKEESSSSNQSTPSCSPRLSFLDSKKKSQPSSTKTIKKNQDTQSLRVSSDVSLLKENILQVQQSVVLSKREPQVQPREQLSNQEKKPVRMSNRSIKPQQASDAIRNKKEEPFIRSNVSDKKSKKTSPELLNIIPTLVPKRKDLSLPITQFHDKQLAEESDAPSVKRSTQLPSCSSRSYKQEMLSTLIFPFQEKIQTIVEESEHYRYIQRILIRIGIDKATPVSLAKWYSQSHPLDPSIFHYLELFHPTITSGGPSKLSRRSQRKLIFYLIDELLVEILTPCIKLNSWAVTKGENLICGSELIDILCKKIGEFPAANCQVLEDIDALIDMDFQRLQVGKSYSFEELESIAVDIERDIMEKLVDETAMIVYNNDI